MKHNDLTLKKFLILLSYMLSTAKRERIILISIIVAGLGG
jgi:hypothetical protein